MRNDRTFHCLQIGPSGPSHQQRQVISPSLIDFWSAERSPSVLTLTSANG
jgi:hypothetical protein